MNLIRLSRLSYAMGTYQTGNLSGFAQRVIDYTYIYPCGLAGGVEGQQFLVVTQGTRLMKSFHDYSIWNTEFLEFTTAGEQSMDTITPVPKSFSPEMTQLGFVHSLLARTRLEASPNCRPHLTARGRRMGSEHIDIFYGQLIADGQ